MPVAALISNIVTGALSVNASLSQNATNGMNCFGLFGRCMTDGSGPIAGNSLLGTANAPVLSSFLTTNVSRVSTSVTHHS